MKIYVDVRERSKDRDIPAKFQAFVASGKCQLVDEVVIGTYLTSDAHDGCGIVGIERKGTDFLISMYDGTLDKQLTELKENFAHPFLFVEYDGIKDMIIKNPQVNPKSIVGEFTSIMARHQVTVMFVGDLYVPFTVRVIEKFHDGQNQVKKISYTPIRSRHQLHKRDPTPQEVKLDIVSRIPKIGAKKGAELLEAFNYSIGNIANASVDDIIKVKGVGKLLASHVKEVLK